jgi:hypothetical protein
VEVIVDREEQRVPRAVTTSALLGVLMIIVCVVLSFALPPDEQQEVRLGLAVGVSMSPLGLLIWWLFRPTKGAWPLVLRLWVCAALAIGSFLLWQRAEQPILAFVFGALYTLLAVMYVACWIAIRRLQAASSITAVASSQPELGVQAGPEGPNASGSESA